MPSEVANAIQTVLRNIISPSAASMICASHIFSYETWETKPPIFSFRGGVGGGGEGYSSPAPTPPPML